MTPVELWPIIVASAAVVFGAGRLAERLRNSKYVRISLCEEKHKNEDLRWDAVREDLEYIRKWIDDSSQRRK